MSVYPQEAAVGPPSADTVEVSQIGAATCNTVQCYINSVQSAGIIDGFYLKNTRAPLELDVDAGTGFIKITDDCLGVTKAFDFAGDTNITLASGGNYIYVDYNSGNPQILATTNEATIEKYRHFVLGLVFKNGAGVLHIEDGGVRVCDQARTHHRRLVERDGFSHISGATATEVGSLNLYVTAGVWYRGLNRLTTALLDTSAAGTFGYQHYGLASWVTDNATATAIDCTHYNDGTDTLGLITTNAYSTQWVYVTAADDYFVIYGTENGALAAAQDATPPTSLPDYISFMGKLIAKIIVRQTGVIVSVETAYGVKFSPEGVPNHGDLGLLNEGDLQHLTAAEYASLAIYTPSVTDGSSNMAAELETFVSANQGKVVKVPDSVTILLNNFGQQGNLGATDHIRIDFGLAKIVYDNTSRSIDLDNTANASAEVTVSSITNKQIYSKSWVSEILLASTLNAEAHDWIAIYSADANPSISGGRMGEVHQLMDDESSLLLHTVGTLGRPTADFATTVRARKLDSTRKLYLKGGIFSANGDADSPAITTREECIRITAFVDPIVLLPTFDAPWAQGLWLQCTGGALVDGLEIKNTLQMGNYSGYSYGCVLYGMNGNPIVRNTVARNCRHPGGTTDGNSSSTTTWYNKGYPTYYKFLNTHGYNCYGSVGDSHEEGIYGLWDGLHCHNSMQDASVAFVGSLFQGRAAMETIRNFSCIGSSRGLTFEDIDHGFQDEVLIENGTLRKLHNGSTSSYAVEFKDNSQTNKRRYRVDKVSSHDVDIGFYVGTNNLVHLNNCPVASAEAYADCKAGSKTIVKGMVSDHRNTTASGATFVFLCRSTVAEGGCEIVCLDKPILIKGVASNQPTHFFDERDILANKTIFVPGITEYNPDSVTATLYKEAGSTTFVEATSVLEIESKLVGDIDLNEFYLKLAMSPATDHTGSGLISSVTVDVNAYGIGAALYIAADGHYEEADADAAGTMPCVAIALEAGAGTKKVLLLGIMRNDSWTFTPGGAVYVSTTAGTLSTTAPTGTGKQVQKVGTAITADILLFNPSPDVIELA